LRAEALKLLWRLWWQSHQPCESPRRFKACLRLPWCDQQQKKVNQIMASLGLIDGLMVVVDR
jgi:hypothetical protein